MHGKSGNGGAVRVLGGRGGLVDRAVYGFAGL
jgi:hypothetical protein